MTLKWFRTVIMRFIILHICLSELTTKIWMKIDRYYQRQNVDNGSCFHHVYADIRGGSLDRGRHMRVGLSKMAIRPIHFFRSLYLPNLHIKGYNYYIVLYSPLVAPHWYRNRWPWMILNGHFALKSVSGSASNGNFLLLLQATGYTRISVYFPTVLSESQKI